MGIAQEMLKKAKGKLNEAKAERRADIVAKKIAKKKSKAAYRKELVSSTIKKAKGEAKADAKAGGKFKRKIKELKTKNKRFKSNRDMSFLSTSQNKPSQSQGDNAREKMTIGGKGGKNPFEL